MKRFPFPEGSIWRKWDLHLHGPDNVINNDFPGANQDEKWEKYIERLAQLDVEAIGFTNYFCIEGLERILAAKYAGKIPNIRTILANIELLLDAQNKDREPINVHLIFNDAVSPQKIRSFLERLPLVNRNNNGQVLYCTLETVKQVGFDQVVVNIERLREALDGFRRNEDYFAVASCNGYGSMRPAQGRTDVLTNELDRWSSFIFGKVENRKFYLKTDRYEGCTPKAVVCGSDAHNLEQMGSNPLWVKADPTFHGLRQIIFEPEDRIAIGAEKPDVRPSYTTIKNVRFADNTGGNLFAGDVIPINSKLTTIIGGKSTGKSLLLFYAAKTIDRMEVDKRLELTSRKEYSLEDNRDFDFEVEWGDGFKQTLQQRKAPGAVESRQIVYIPQAFLNRLSEADKGSQDTLNEFVLSVLLQDSEAQKAYDHHRNSVRQAESDIAGLSDQILGFRQQEDSFKAQLKEMGDADAIRRHISEIVGEIEKIRAQSGLTIDETTRLQSLSTEEAELRRSLRNLENDKKVLEQHRQKNLSLIKQVQSGVESSDGLLNTAEVKTAFAEHQVKLRQFLDIIESSDRNLSSVIENRDQSLKARLADVEGYLKPLNDRLSLGDEIGKKDKLKKVEEEKLTKIDLLEKQLESCRSQLRQSISDLKSRTKSILGSYRKIQVEFKKYESKLVDIVLNIQVHINELEFTESVDECLGKAVVKKELGVSGDGSGYVFSADNHSDLLDKIIDGVSSGEMKPLKRKSIAECLQAITKNRYSLDFKITYKNDPLSKMSPGKKGLTLLRLLIDLSERQWPILLDQPEDDLDNRSVYADLVSFIRKKKNERQIVIVTHNPNLVVGADAEQIIVANQAGQEVNRENKSHRFEYVSGSIEHCFVASDAEGILNTMGIREHVCEILEGGAEAFKKREAKYQ
jgi:hypothetical protein